MAESSTSVVRSLLALARRLRLTEVVRVSGRYMPKAIQHRIAMLRMKLRARSGEVDAYPLLVPEAELKRAYGKALDLLIERHGPEGVGHYLEFGVYVGTSMSCMYDALTEHKLDKVRLFGFDSFEGLPEDAAADNSATWEPGEFSAPLSAARATLSARGVDLKRVELVKGWFDESLTPELLARHDLRKASVIMVDCDLYSSAKVALDFCASLIVDDAIILFDDWWPSTLGEGGVGEKRAFEEFLAEHPSLSATELESYAPDESTVFLVSRAPVDQSVATQQSVRHG